jgi:molecular chaperone GrpE (heat shock protein)
MRQKLMIYSSILLLAGVTTLRWSLTERKEEQKQADYYRAKYASEMENFVKQYNEWLQKPADGKKQFSWGLDKTETQAQLQQKQQERLIADVDKLATGEADLIPFADFFYGENWQEEVSKYKTHKNQRELILTCSIVCTSAGGMIVTCSLLLWTARLVIRVLSLLKKLAANFFKKITESLKKHKLKLKTKATKDLKKRSKILTDSGWHNFEANQVERSSKKPANNNEKALVSDIVASGYQNAAVQLCTENCIESEETLKDTTECLNLNTTQLKCSTTNVQQNAFENADTLGNSLKELTQQVSAIREYAYQQQDRVEKLQNGYDLGIIRTFCLRVIRCIENLEERINKLSEENAETAHLRELRDELLFALESSGIERFEPEINSDYHGQERYAEAVKERQCSDNPNMTDKIAKVIRPGYQYIIDHGNTKIVSKAKVMLYG